MIPRKQSKKEAKMSMQEKTFKENKTKRCDLFQQQGTNLSIHPRKDRIKRRASQGETDTKDSSNEKPRGDSAPTSSGDAKAELEDCVAEIATEAGLVGAIDGDDARLPLSR